MHIYAVVGCCAVTVTSVEVTSLIKLDSKCREECCITGGGGGGIGSAILSLLICRVHHNTGLYLHHL